MVEDSEIKATISPFAVREGEIKVFDGKDKYVSIGQIIKKIDLGHITELHFKIMELINKFEFLTSRQLYQLLVHNGEDIKSQDKLNTRLEQLLKSKILTRYYFKTGEESGIYRIYCMEKMGKYLLNSRGIECKWQPTDNTKPISMIKKRLAGNQVIIAYLRKVTVTESYKVKPAINAKRAGKVFKPTGGQIKLTKGNKSIDFIFEVIRREEEWEEKLKDRMLLYQDFYENFVQMDSGFSIKPQLIFVCEDERHMAEVFKEIVTKKLEIEDTKLYFSTDLRYNNDSLENSLVEFKIDEKTNKYKIKEVELKSLAKSDS